MAGASNLEPRTPVLVGVAAVSERAASFDDARAALDLMAEALERSAEGAPDLLAAVDQVIVPEGTWLHSDPGRLLAERLGVAAHTVLAEVGVLQTTPYAVAASRIAAGEAGVVAIVGGEAKHRDRLAAKAGHAPDEDRSPGTPPDETWAPSGDILPAIEIERDLAVPAQQYAVMEQAVRRADGLTIEEHRQRLAELWAGFSEVAARNDHTWSRDAVSPDSLTVATSANPWISTPYTRLHCSQWNVDQAAASLMCSVEVAERLGVPRERWVFPLASADSDEMIPLTRRADVATSPGFGVAGHWVAARLGVPLDELEVRELYSCFPAAVQIQVRELALTGDRPLTTSGGMSFAGGPLNNFVLQAMEPFVAALRADATSRGLLTAVSGMITKQGVSVWSCTPPTVPFAAGEVGATSAERTAVVDVDPVWVGRATVESWTVVHQGGVPWRAVALARTPTGQRAVVRCDDPDVVSSMVDDEWGDREIDCRGEWFEA